MFVRILRRSFLEGVPDTVYRRLYDIDSIFCAYASDDSVIYGFVPRGLTIDEAFMFSSKEFVFTVDLIGDDRNTLGGKNE